MNNESTLCISSIPGYRIDTEIYESQHSIAYRGVREQDGSPVVIKVLKDRYPPPKQLARYRREYEITALLKDKPGIIKVFELTRCENALALITEDFGASSLKHLLAQRAVRLEEALFIGSQVASGLHEIHSARVIHKDLNPANILYNPLHQAAAEAAFLCADFESMRKLTTEVLTRAVSNIEKVKEGIAAGLVLNELG